MNSHRLETTGLSPRRFDLREAILATGWLPARESAYLSSFARVEGFTRGMLDDLVFRDRAFAEVGSVRGHAFLVPREIVPAALSCPAPSQKEAAEQVLERSAVPRSGREPLLDAVRQALSEGPVALPDLLSRVTAAPGAPAKFLGMPGVLPSVLGLLRLEGEVARTRLEPPLDSGPPVFALTSEVFPDLDCAGLPPRDALRILCAYYFRVHGPATKADFGWWCGAGRTEVAEVFEEHRPRLVSVRLGEEPFTCWLPRSRLDELLSTTRAGADPVTLVPFSDPWLASHEGQAGRFVRAEDLPQAVPGPVMPLVLVGGIAVGCWEYETGTGEVRLRFFRPVADGVRERAEAVAEESAEWMRREMPGLRPMSVPGPDAPLPVYV